ncbi:MAG TPA: HupE/UreJ family protein [Candidatus Dormibacteraeota bacterium]|nr:HupE/UreJ family protein [Candidatus Dormibacteraeota bacterium]
MWCSLTTTAFAHDPGLSTAIIRVQRDGLQVGLILSTRDAAALVEAVQGSSSAGISRRLPGVEQLRQLAAGAMEIRLDDRPAAIAVVGCQIDETNANVTFTLRVEGQEFTRIRVRSQWLALLPPGHRQFLSIQDADGAAVSQQLLSAQGDSAAVTLEKVARPGVAQAAPGQSFAAFLALGIKHILTGYDHLLFLFSLLVVSRGCLSTVKVITCFTVAHSITLALATLGWVQIPGRIVEPLIAASIIYVGVENLVRGDAPRGRGLLTFAFGLVHGLGFASVLREIGVASSPGGVVMPLFSFNLGVELGQLLIAVVALPLIWELARRPLLAKRCLPVSSAVVALAGSYWLIQRLCG